MDNEQIKLLDGTTWDKGELVSAMTDDAFYYSYLGEAALSSSASKKLNEGPQAYLDSLESNGDNPAFAIGKYVHMSILEPHLIEERVVVIDVKSRDTIKFEKALEKASPEEVLLSLNEPRTLIFRCG